VNHAHYAITSDRPDLPLVIRDLGPWDQYPTITNDAEHVVETLVKEGELSHSRRLLYYDSDNNLDEIVIRDGKFSHFKPYGGF
jgi:hypothetical protein